jgi:tol-pal system protein YbgF
MRVATPGPRIGRRVWRLVPLVALGATSGCFATRGDVRLVQTDIASLRSEMTRGQREQQESLTRTLQLLQVASDSLTRLSARTVSLQGDVRGEMRNVREQLLQVRTLLGESQATIARLRAELEARTVPVAAPGGAVTPAGTGTVPSGSGSGASKPAGGSTPRPDTVAAAPDPGPNQLFMTGRDQLLRGSTSTARATFQELIAKYPTHDYAPDAQYWIAESLAKEKNLAAADAAYAAVVQTYPNSELAARALYKRGLLAIEQGNTAQGKALLQQVIARYPRSDSAALAEETLKTLR